MSEVSVRELRNDVSGVLRRAEAGEVLVVTVRGRPVAELGPLKRKPRFISAAVLMEALRDARPDPGLREDLRRLSGDETTDDLIDPWDR